MTKIHQHLQTINDYHDPEDQLFQIYYLVGLLETAQIIHDPERKLIDCLPINNPQLRIFLLDRWTYELDMML